MKGLLTPLVSLNKTLLHPYFWGGSLTSDDVSIVFHPRRWTAGTWEYTGPLEFRNIICLVAWQGGFLSQGFRLLVVEPTHLKNMLVKMGSSSPNFQGENKKILELVETHLDFIVNFLDKKQHVLINWLVFFFEKWFPYVLYSIILTIHRIHAA